MKALSVVAPGGTRIASGEKTLEVRRWLPNLGRNEDLLIVENGKFLTKDGEVDHDGCVVAIVCISRVRSFLPEDMATACGTYFEEGWLAWELEQVRPIKSSKSVIAARGIYEIDLPEDTLFR
ncbi:ASCH domain-containing protein [Sphingomonas parapaucimobilis]|uniref:ASCH domain-containing protein n=1 Tax=Sphingomonas parapaucimobilis TaxID=28213 RepID=UPI00391B2425